MNNNIDYNKNGLIIAPAGYGKTEDIAIQVQRLKTNKKILILTHTNVGIDELSIRIKKYNIISSKVNIMTIASFSLKYIKMFPSISGYDKDKDLFDNDIYSQMNSLLKNIHIRQIIKNSYDQLFVDEYQDCNLSQHEMIKEICNILNYKIYGDPLQSIFEFNDEPVNFEDAITKDFELIGKLDYPWRWQNKNKKLGEWISQVRKQIENNEVIDLYNIPNTLNFIKTNDIYGSLRKVGFNYISNNIFNVILTKLPYQTKSYVKSFGGKYKMQEELECNDLKKIAKFIDNNNKEEALIELFNILKSSYIGLNKYDNIINKLKSRCYDFSKLKNNRELGNKILEYLNNEKIDVVNIIDIINLIENSDGIKICRYELINVMKRMLNNIKISKNIKALDILQEITSNRKQINSNYLISRVLLVKGLQFKNVIVVEPEKMTKKEFYVAISRATESLTILSKEKYIKFK